MTSFIDLASQNYEKKDKTILKVAYADFWPEWVDENFIEPILNETYNVEIDQKNPDVLFYSIFGNSHTKYKCKKVLYVAENIRYPYNDSIRKNINSAYENSDYTITFDPPTEKNFRLPLWQVFILRNPSYIDRLLNRVNHSEFERFCSFTVSNPSNSLRNNAFDGLSTYKRVHAYGKVRMNDLGLNRASQGRYWRDAKDEFFLQHPHKFMLTFENTSYPYYCTEKLMDSFLVGSLPIYWGDPKVEEDWNTKAFINAMKKPNWLDLVKTADSNKTFWEELYLEPVFNDNQRIRHLNNIEEFKWWLTKIVK